ncbi:response regulator transcription factor [Sphingopyxis sp.]|uniref:response regulator transcription factor n=1 Tax=Sphingopyxis sp. TaxID=1908224 RepID=UPI003D12440C
MNRDFASGGPKKSGIDALSVGEIDCLDLVADGLGSKDIARRLDISPHTVDARLKSACAKLGTKSRFHAASMLRDAGRPASDVTVTSAHANLVYEDRKLPQSALPPDKRSSAGEGDGPDGLRSSQGLDREARASRKGKSWLEPSHPIAKYFGGENKLSIGQRLLTILAIGIGAAIAVGILANALVGISMLGTPP